MNMETSLNEFKIALTAGFWAVIGFLGWHGVALVAWVILMLIDYASGTLAAKHQKSWNSETARNGVMHKGGMVLVVAAAGITDLVLYAVCEKLPMTWDWPFALVLLVLVWYILTEVGSILENAGKMGAPIPEWFTAVLDAGLKTVDTQGAEIAGKIRQDKAEQEGIENG